MYAYRSAIQIEIKKTARATHAAIRASVGRGGAGNDGSSGCSVAKSSPARWRAMTSGSSGSSLDCRGFGAGPLLSVFTARNTGLCCAVSG